MTDLPYMKWYPADVESDEAWLLMSCAERGLYITLLNHAWINRGLPQETWKIARIAGISQEEVDGLWPRVSIKFVLDEDGRLVNLRQEDERRGASEKSKKLSANAAHNTERKRPGSVYLIRRQSDGAIKIGSSEHVSRRLAQLKYKYRSDCLSLVSEFQTENMGDLEIRLQEAYAAHRINGEWFNLSQSDLLNLHSRITPRGDSGITQKGDSGHHPALRAYDSDSDSISGSDSLSSERESEGKPAADAEMDEFSVWASGIHLSHPNSSDKYQSLLTLKNRFSQDQEARESFARNHALWVQSEKWQEKQGAFVPRLWKWIEDDGWKKAPPTPIRKQESLIERMAREAREEETANGTR